MPKTLQVRRTVIDAVTATTTSSAISLEGVRKVTIFGTRADHSSGSTAFSATVSGDGTTYVATNKIIINIASDAGAGTAGEDIGYTKAASFSLAANGTAFGTLDLTHDAFHSMKVVATETTDGTHTAKVVLEYF